MYLMYLLNLHLTGMIVSVEISWDFSTNIWTNNRQLTNNKSFKHRRERVCNYCILFFIIMQKFVYEADTTIGVEEVQVTVTSQALLYKIGAAAGWSSSQLNCNITKGKYTFSVDLVETAANNGTSPLSINNNNNKK